MVGQNNEMMPQKILPSLFHGRHDCRQFSHIRGRSQEFAAEGLAEESNGMVLLGQDNSHADAGNVRLNDEWLREVRQAQNWGCANCFLEFVKSKLSLRRPLKLVFDQEASQRCYNRGIAFNEATIETRETQETVQGSGCPGNRPNLNHLHLGGHKFNTSLGNYMAQILHLLLGKGTLREFQEEMPF